MKRIISIVAIITLAFVALSVSHTRFFEFLELKLLDVQFTSRGPVQADPKIVVVGIDEKSLKELGQWPWSRDKLAVMVRNLREAGAKVIGFDVVFAEVDRSGRDAVFAGELRRSEDAVLGYYLSESGVTDNIAGLAGVSSKGLLNVYPDADGIVRRSAIVVLKDAKFVGSFALELVAKFLDFMPVPRKDAAGNLTRIMMGDRIVPVDTNGRMMINYTGSPHHMLSASDVVSGRLDRAVVKDAIVIFGAVAAGLSDIRATPFSPATAGVEIHANAVDNMISGRYLARSSSSDLLNILSLIIIAILAAVAFSRTGIFVSLLGLAVLLLAILGYGYYSFLNGLWVPVIYQLLEALSLFVAISLYRYFTEGMRRRMIHNAFKFYLAPEVIDGLLKNEASLKLGGEKREITVLFADVRSFTKISERLEPGKLIAMMNEYFTQMTDIIMEEGGMVDKYIGDAIMAFFGAPAPHNDHADRACRAAVRMQNALQKMEPLLKERYGIDGFKIGIGLNSGEAFVGNMGSNKRFNYTAIGDAVNVASRLEGLTKEFGVPVILSSQVISSCIIKPAVRSLGSVQVKGRTEEIRIFTV